MHGKEEFIGTVSSIQLQIQKENDGVLNFDHIDIQAEEYIQRETEV